MNNLQKKPTLLLTNHHLDVTGGGTYVMMVINLLKNFYSIYVDNYLSYYHHPETPYRLEEEEVYLADSNFMPDFHLLASYRGWIQPRSENNAQIVFFPLDKKIEGWKNAISLNEFVDRKVKERWPDISSWIIHPHLNPKKYYIGKKENTCISIGSYFEEPDGHSKNQHLIIEWFLKNKKSLGLDKLILHGFNNGDLYFNRLMDMAKRDYSIEIKTARTQDEIRADLSTSKYLIHALGFGRTDQSQVEHFGLIAVEAMLAGAQPIVHNSGGCREILGVKTYNDFDDITEHLLETRLITDPLLLRRFGEIYREEHSLGYAAKLVSALQNDVTASIKVKNSKKKLNLGCGNDYKDDFINVDIGACKKDVEHDLESFPYPFEDNTFNEIVMKHTIEYISRKNFPKLMEELYRIATPDCVIHISAPYYLSRNAFTDFTHRNFMTEESFGYFDPTHQLRELGKVYGLLPEFNVKFALNADRFHPEVSIHYQLNPIKQW